MRMTVFILTAENAKDWHFQPYYETGASSVNTFGAHV